MITNITGYMKNYGHLSFDRKPMTEVDCLIFCQLAYLIFDKFVGAPTLSVAFSTFNSDAAMKELTDDTLYPAKNVLLLQALFQSERYKNMKLESYSSLVDPVKAQQFAAMVFRFPSFAFIAFRGTDVTILGWKEDFHMSYNDIVPAQEESVRYLNKILKELPMNLAVYVGGHSKGGNLATYASAYCERELQSRINLVRNFDGPGFRTNVFMQDTYTNIEGRLKKFVPHDTIVGVIMLHNPEFRIVKCWSFGIWQHDPFNWQINNDTFVYKKKRTKASLAMEKSLYILLEEMTDEQRERTIRDIFDLLEECDIKKVTDFRKRPLKKISAIISRFHHYDKEEQRLLRRTASFILKMYLKNYFSVK